MNLGIREASMINGIPGAERGYQIIETMMEQQTSKMEDKKILQLELPSEITDTLLEKGFFTSDESTSRMEITPKGIKLLSIVENLHEILQA